MGFMKDAVAPLSTYPVFRNIIAQLTKHPLLALLAGFLMTTILQSSSASMGILIALSSQGLMPLSGALPILYGDNIGSCTTSLLSSIGANKNAKRAATMHLCFNIIGTILFMFVLNKPITAVVQYLNPADPARQIANSHTLFNVVNVIILLPFSKLIVKLAMLLIPDRPGDEEDDSVVTKYLDERMLETPAIAFANIVRESLRMGGKARDSFSSATNALINRSEKSANESFEKEKIINEEQKAIIGYLIKLSNKALDEKMRLSLDLLFHTINDIERVGDLSENIAELAREAIDSNIKFSDEGLLEVKDIFSKTYEAYSLALDAMKANDTKIAEEVLRLVEEVDKLDKTYRNDHMRRLNKNLCTIDSGIVYLDLLTNIERISDHAASIAKRVIMVNE
jgi:phosphate:Na+ symporter